MNTLHKIKRRLLKAKNKSKDYFLYSYQKDGTFDYNTYKKFQEEGNKRKINSSWIQQSDIDFLSKKIKSSITNPSFGICHGTRQGFEQKWFSERLNCPVIGTEISETATQFPNTVQWDFHEINPEWSKKADFVYSNSFDHSYDPEKALTAWMETLTPHGVCIIEHSKYHNPDAANELDPFGARLEIMPFLVLKWSKGKYSVREIWEHECTDHLTKEAETKYYLVIQHN